MSEDGGCTNCKQMIMVQIQCIGEGNEKKTATELQNWLDTLVKQKQVRGYVINETKVRAGGTLR